METNIVDPYLFSFKLFKKDAENVVSALDSLFSGFSPSYSLSFDGMAICKEEQISSIIESIFINLAEKSSNKENINKDIDVSAIVDNCSPEQKIVLRSIEKNVSSIIPELIASYQNHLHLFNEDISIRMPPLNIPIQYYEKQLPGQTSISVEYIDIIEIEFQDEIVYVPMSFTLSEFASFYSSRIFPGSECGHFLFFIKGNTYINLPNSEQNTVSLDDPMNVFTQSLASWLKQTHSYFLPSEIQTFNANHVRFEDLQVQLNYPYLLMIQHNSTFMEFHFSVKNCYHYDSVPGGDASPAFINTSISRSAFPFMIYKKSKQKPSCYVCKKEVASYVVSNDILSPMSPMYYCLSCMRRFHYDKENKLITPSFSAQSISFVSTKHIYN